MSRASTTGIRIVEGRPAVVADKIGFEDLQSFRVDALAGNEGYKRRRRTRDEVAYFVGLTTRRAWDDPNHGIDIRSGQRRWDPRVTLALEDGHRPVAYWYAARNTSSSLENRLVYNGYQNKLTDLLGMAERGLKRVIAPQRYTYVWTKEYAALPGYEYLVPHVGAVALNSYPQKLPGTIYPISEDAPAKSSELTTFGFEYDENEPLAREGIFGPDTINTFQERWVVSSIGKAVQNMLLEAEIPEVPNAVLLTP